MSSSINLFIVAGLLITIYFLWRIERHLSKLWRLAEIHQDLLEIREDLVKIRVKVDFLK